jgi:hypothetical protein
VILILITTGFRGGARKKNYRGPREGHFLAVCYFY